MDADWRGFGAAMFRVLSPKVRAAVVTSHVSLNYDFAPLSSHYPPIFLYLLTIVICVRYVRSFFIDMEKRKFDRRLFVSIENMPENT